MLQKQAIAANGPGETAEPHRGNGADAARRRMDGEAEDSLPLHVYLERLLGAMSVLWRSRRPILGTAIPATLAIFAALYLIPNRYTAVAVLNPPDLNPVSGLAVLGMMKGGRASGLGSTAADVLGLSTLGQEYVRMMQTRRIEDMLIQQFGLQKVYRTAGMDQARNVLASASSFSVDRKSNVIEISVTDRDPNRAAELANGYAAALGTVVAALTSSAGGQEREYFEAQLGGAESELEAATERLSRYGQKNAAIGVDSGAKGLADAMGLLQGRIIATEAELKAMRAVYAEDNDRVKAMEAQLGELKRQMTVLAGPSGAPAPGDGSGGPSLAHLWSTAPAYLDLEGEVKLKAAMVETLAQQYEFAKLEEAHRVSGIQLLDPALPPVKKSGPHRALTALAAGMLIFVAMCGGVLGKDWWTKAAADDPWKMLLAPRLAPLTASFVRRRATNSPAADPARRGEG